jgi:hypothetical protein
VAPRVRLISYYYQQMIAEPRAHHILWLIENHPEAEVFGIASYVTSFEVTWHGLNTIADRDKARALWLRQTERFSSDTAVLAHAAQALPIEESIRVMRLRMLGPSNPVWTVNLASVYAGAVRNVFYAISPTARRAFAGPVRHRSMWQMWLPGAGPELADAEGRPSFNLLQNYGSAGAPLHFFVFDVLTLKGKDVTGESLLERRILLEKQVLSKSEEVLHLRIW